MHSCTQSQRLTRPSRRRGRAVVEERSDETERRHDQQEGRACFDSVVSSVQALSVVKYPCGASPAVWEPQAYTFPNGAVGRWSGFLTPLGSVHIPRTWNEFRSEGLELPCSDNLGRGIGVTFSGRGNLGGGLLSVKRPSLTIVGAEAPFSTLTNRIVAQP